MASPSGSLTVEHVRRAAGRLGDHPQDHGWRPLYRLIASGLEKGHPGLRDRIAMLRSLRPEASDTHFVTLLGIALHALCPGELNELLDDDRRGGTDPEGLLERVVDENAAGIDGILRARQNSFTGTRRFLGPQVLIASYFARTGGGVSLADLGTGLGIMPRQIGCRAVFDRFASDLRWPHGAPVFRPIPIDSRAGVDRGPMPDLRWVKSCYGPSPYYDRLFDELMEAIDLTEATSRLVDVVEVDLLDTTRLVRFLRHRRVNVVNLSYVLYELAPTIRFELLETVIRHLRPPRLVVVTEPKEELAGRGCTMTVYDERGEARRVCAVSDGHFRGDVTPLDDFDWFVSRYPIAVAEGQRA